MAVAWDATGGGNLTTGSSATLATSWSHTIATSGSTTVVIVAVSQSVSTNSASTTCSVSYGGTAMNQVYYLPYGSGTNRAALGMYYLFNPPTGAQTVTATSGGTSTKDQIQGQSVSYTGVVTLTKLNTATARSVVAPINMTGSMAFAAIANGTTLSAPSKTSRYLSGATTSGLGDYLCVQDTVSDVPVTFANSGTNTTPRSVTVVLSPGGYPSTATLTDDFSVQDAVKWAGWDVGCYVSSGKLTLDCSTAYYGITSIPSFDFTNSSITFQLLQTPNVGNGTTEAYGGIVLSTANFGICTEGFYWSYDTLSVWRSLGSVEYGTASATYDPTKHQWMRITESNGTLRWWTSGDGIGWSVFDTGAAAFPLEGVSVTLQSGYWGTEPTPGSAVFDNVNVSNSAGFLGYM